MRVHAVPEHRGVPDRDADLHDAKDDVMPVARVDRHLRLPELGERLGEQKADDRDQHQGLAQQPDARLVQLRVVDLRPQTLHFQRLRLRGGQAHRLRYEAAPYLQ